MFHLYVVGVTETGPDAVRRLSEAMAARYGLPAGDLHARMLQGPVRVKSNVDRATADRYVQDLESIGARVQLEEVLVRTERDTRAPRDDRRFAPPSAEDPDAALELVPDERFARDDPASTLPAPPPPPVPSATPAARSPARRRALARPRVRFAAGIALSIILGFVPAHLVAALRETSAYRAIDSDVLAAQTAVQTPAEYRALDAIRAERLAAKRSARTSIMITAFAIWAAAGGALAYIWFKRIPWSKLV